MDKRRSRCQGLIEGGAPPIGQTIALTYNLRGPVHHNGSVPRDWDAEFDSPEAIEAMASALRAAGHTVELVEATDQLTAWFLTHPVDLVFNIAEGTHGPHRESQVPAILESLGIPFTGSSSFTLSLALDKARTKQVLAYDGLPTPPWQLFAQPDELLKGHLTFPLIVKPNREGSAKGILRDSVVADERALRQRIRWVQERYRQEVLVEEFIEGTELTVGVLGNEEPQALPILEIDFTNCRAAGEHFYSWHMKETEGQVERGCTPSFHCPARLGPELSAQIQLVALRSHHALGCFDFSRTDIRLRRDGVPFVLEVNPLPGLSPTESNFPIMTTAAGIPHPALITRLVELALARYRHAGLPSTPVSWAGASRQVAQTQEPSASPAIWRGQLVESRTAP